MKISSVRLTLLIVALPHLVKKLKVKGRSKIAGKLEIRGYNLLKKPSTCIAHYVKSKKSNSFINGCNVLKKDSVTKHEIFINTQNLYNLSSEVSLNTFKTDV